MSQDQEPRKTADHETLASALDTIVQILVGKELEAVRSSVRELETSLTKRVETIQRQTNESVDRTVKDLSSRIDEVGLRLTEMDALHKKSVADIEQRTWQSVSDLKTELHEARSKAESRAQTLENELKKTLTINEESLKKELDGLAQGGLSLQLELQQQAEATKRVSGLLDRLARVFSPATTGATQPAGAGTPTEESLDTVLERVFHGRERPATEQTRGR